MDTSAEQLLVSLEHDVVAVRDVNPHMADVEVLTLAQRHAALVITMDKNVGDLVYKDLRPHQGVLLLRLEDAMGPERTTTIIRLILGEYAAELPGRFAVFQHERLRISG